MLHLVFVYLIIVSSRNVFTLEQFEPSWESLDNRPLPRWYDEAKVGIFIHWGIYSVPSFGTELIYFDPISNNFEYNMKRNYKPNFLYQDFANDFTAELFNATQWALLFRDSGARYVVLTSKHHDGFTLWPSTYSSHWNSVDIGPKIDIVMEVATAIRKYTTLKFGLYYSLLEWFNRLFDQDELQQFEDQLYVDWKMLPEQKELVLMYLPEVFWSDGDWAASAEYWKSKEFLAWLYNESPVRDTIVTNDRWGVGTNCKHGDFFNCIDRYNPGIFQHHKWENAFTLDRTSWGQRYDVSFENFMTSEELILNLVKTVSCNGNVLINIAPTKCGTILPIFEERLRDMGDWLYTNGEAIYGSQPWIYQSDSLNPNVWYTQHRNGNFYAIVTKYPYAGNNIELRSVWQRLYNINVAQVHVVLLGMEDTPIKWTLSKESAHINFPPKHEIDKRKIKFAWTLKFMLPTT